MNKNKSLTVSFKPLKAIVSTLPSLSLITALALLTACGDSGGSPEAGASTLATAARTTMLSSGDTDCPNGGILVETGIDDNANSVLDSDEVDSEEKVCNGINGAGGSNAPGIVSAISISNTEILVQFSEPMLGDVEIEGHYSITSQLNGTRLPVWNAMFANADKSSVLLSTYSQSSIGYEFTVTNVRDLDGNPMAEPTLDPDFLIDPSRTTFVGSDPSSSTTADSDGDNLPDHAELVGWDITVTYANGTTETKHVSSDPGDPNKLLSDPVNLAAQDTDSDGVSDNEEKHGGMDPRNSDTDGDTLTDDQEWNTIFSDATHQDSDGDGVQDGFEFYTFRTSPILVDTDGDQIDDLEEVTSGNRNPLIADLPQVRVTVGSLNLQLNTKFSFTDGQGSTQNVTQTNEAQLTASEALSNQQSNGGSTEKTIENSKSLTAQVSFTPKALTGGYSGTISKTETDVASSSFSASQDSSASVGRAYNDSLQTTSELNITSTVAREVIGGSIKAFVTVESLSDIPFTISNMELSLQSQSPFDRKKVIPIATLIPENNAFESINLGVIGDSEKGPFVFTTIEGSVFPEQVEKLMKSPRGLLAKFANFDVTDELGRNFSYSSQEVLDRTVLISFDFGNGNQEVYRIATASTHNPANGKPMGITMEYALSIAGLQRYETIRDGGNGVVDTLAVGDDEQLVSVGSYIEPGAVVITAGENGTIESVPSTDDLLLAADYETALKVGTNGIIDGGNGIVETLVNPSTDDVQILSVGERVSVNEKILISAGRNGVLTTLPGGDDIVKQGLGYRRMLTRYRDYESSSANRHYWYLFESVQSLAVDFDSKVLRAGESYNFSYLKDEDADGVWASEEYLHGSSDNDANEDGCYYGYDASNDASNWQGRNFWWLGCDLLNDQEEIQLGWIVKTTDAAVAYRVYSNPVEWDSDQDFVPDSEERDCGLDPRSADTDGDGLTDYQELYGQTPNPVYGAPSPLYSIDPLTGLQKDRIVAYAGPLSGFVDHPGDGTLASLPVEWKNCFTFSATKFGFGYATNPLNPDTDGDGVSDGRELQLGLHPNNPDDGGLGLDDDNDGLSNTFEETPRTLIKDTHINPPIGPIVINGVTSDPNSADSDGDYLPDLLEFYIGSNPNSPDTDGDLLGDYDEYKPSGQACVQFRPGYGCSRWIGNAYGSSYRDFEKACAAVSGCSIETLLEDLQYSRNIGTDINSADTDNDGIVDSREVDVYLTNPLLADTDGDRCSDFKEINQYFTDPTNSLSVNGSCL
jgi:hypothetical protein